MSKYRHSDQSDNEHSTECARNGCFNSAEHGIHITISGRELWKKFCYRHLEEEIEAEALFQAGL